MLSYPGNSHYLFAVFEGKVERDPSANFRSLELQRLLDSDESPGFTWTGNHHVAL